MAAMKQGQPPLEKRPTILTKESELRFDLAPESEVQLVLREHTAEIEGIEMAPNYTYTFIGTKFAVFTWYGCTLEVTGASGAHDSVYLSTDTPMVTYVNTHAQLEARRDTALQALTNNPDSNATGPRVIIVGGSDTGKSTLANILAAYAVRMGRCPTFVDLDPGQGQITLPGALAAVSLDSQTLSIEEKYTLAAPLVFYFGHTNMRENVSLFRHQCDRMAEAVDQRVRNDRDASASGVFLNTCGWWEGEGFQTLLHCINAFGVDVVLVMGNDRLYSDIISQVSSAVTVVKLPVSEGAVKRDPKDRKVARSARFQEYFYGIRASSAKGPKGPAPPLSPSVLELRFDDVRICRVGGTQLSSAMLPVGSSALLGPMQVTTVRITMELQYSVLAVCHPVLRDDGTVLGQDPGIEQGDITGELLKSNTAGFLYVQKVDLERRRFTVLSPCPGALPSKYLLMGSIKWME